MSQHALDRFIKRLSSDDALQDQLVEFGMRQGLAPGRGRLSEQAIVEFAVQQGFELSLDEVRGGNLSRELSAQPTAPLTTLPKPGSRPARSSSDWWAWLGD